MEDIVYSVITAFTSGGSLVFGLCFLFLYIPESTFLGGYRVARKMTAIAYLGLSSLYLIEIFFDNHDVGHSLSQSIKLTVGSVQALFFTYTFISLINTRFVTEKKVWRELLPILFFIVIMVVSYVLGSNSLIFITIVR